MINTCLHLPAFSSCLARRYFRSNSFVVDRKSVVECCRSCASSFASWSSSTSAMMLMIGDFHLPYVTVAASDVAAATGAWWWWTLRLLAVCGVCSLYHAHRRSSDKAGLVMTPVKWQRGRLRRQIPVSALFCSLCLCIGAHKRVHKNYYPHTYFY